ncbi:unnamed protein product [Anisakis simplex]|uniref:Chalcone synthase n=1 Tax=Anisakis simplex TaxID=6269 RepID=A0A0M3JA02_ANISI|nr:unnamed protein product [Anisakis simplex]
MCDQFIGGQYQQDGAENLNEYMEAKGELCVKAAKFVAKNHLNLKFFRNFWVHLGWGTMAGAKIDHR